MYISRLVKTRDLYPGLLQFVITVSFPFLSKSAFHRCHLSLLSLSSSLLFHHRLSGGAVTPFSL
jgi:hypothetical protein